MENKQGSRSRGPGLCTPAAQLETEVKRGEDLCKHLWSGVIYCLLWGLSHVGVTTNVFSDHICQKNLNSTSLMDTSMSALWNTF